eukprot:SM000186S04143  [mRNA]  locus=s186:267881:269336:- [translate_table: standard]
MVVVRDVDGHSLCAGCLLPFRVRCHVAYVPCKQRVVGLSKLPRVIAMFAQRLQTPSALAKQVVEAISEVLDPLGAAIVVESWHVRNVGAATMAASFAPGETQQHGGTAAGHMVPCTAAAATGCFLGDDGALWAEFVALLCLPAQTENQLRPPFAFAEACHSDGVIAASLACPFSLQPLQEECSSCNGSPCNDHGRRPAGPGVADKFISTRLAETAPALQRALEAESCQGSGTLSLPVKRYLSWLSASTSGGHGFSWDGSLQAMGTPAVFLPLHVPVPPAPGEDGSECSANGWLLQEARVQLHAELALPLSSLCEHHLLPFVGCAHVGFAVEAADSHGKAVPHSRSSLDRRLLGGVVSLHSRRLQVQERLTRQIAEAAAAAAASGSCAGVMVVVEATHMCMMARGIEKVASGTATVATLGCFSSSPRLRAAFLKLLRRDNSSRTLQLA